MKLDTERGSASLYGRPFTGAWIETPMHVIATMRSKVAPSRGRGLKPRARGPSWHVVGRPFTGAWIETMAEIRKHLSVGVAPSRGRGLKLTMGKVPSPLSLVAPSRGRGLKRT